MLHFCQRCSFNEYKTLLTKNLAHTNASFSSKICMSIDEKIQFCFQLHGLRPIYMVLG